MKKDDYGQLKINEWEATKRLYDISLDYDSIMLTDPQSYNTATERTGMPWEKIQEYREPICTPEEWHKQNQTIWHMPEEYKDFDIEQYLKLKCNTVEELDRIELELSLFRHHNLSNLLRYMLYLVHIMTANKIIWGVGRGSSVASFALFLIGAHRVNPLLYNLDIKEFFK